MNIHQINIARGIFIGGGMGALLAILIYISLLIFGLTFFEHTEASRIILNLMTHGLYAIGLPGAVIGAYLGWRKMSRL